jgi:hypothetical protein
MYEADTRQAALAAELQAQVRIANLRACVRVCLSVRVSLCVCVFA